MVLAPDVVARGDDELCKRATKLPLLIEVFSCETNDRYSDAAPELLLVVRGTVTVKDTVAEPVVAKFLTRASARFTKSGASAVSYRSVTAANADAEKTKPLMYTSISLTPDMELAMADRKLDDAASEVDASLLTPCNVVAAENETVW